MLRRRQCWSRRTGDRVCATGSTSRPIAISAPSVQVASVPDLTTVHCFGAGQRRTPPSGLVVLGGPGPGGCRRRRRWPLSHSAWPLSRWLLLLSPRHWRLAAWATGTDWQGRYSSGNLKLAIATCIQLGACSGATVVLVAWGIRAAEVARPPASGPVGARPGAQGCCHCARPGPGGSAQVH